MPEKRPWGITLNVILLALTGLVMFLGVLGVTLLSSLTWLSTNFTGFGVLLAGLWLVMILIAVIVFALAYLLWNGNKYAWWALVILLILGIIGNVFSLSVIALFLDVLLLAGLLHKDSISFVNPGIQWRGWELES